MCNIHAASLLFAPHCKNWSGRHTLAKRESTLLEKFSSMSILQLIREIIVKELLISFLKISQMLIYIDKQVHVVSESEFILG